MRAREAFACLTIARHSVCCSPTFFPSLWRSGLGQRQGSSDGGALLLKAADRDYGLIGCLAACLRDERQAGKIDHSLKELLAQRVFSIACGYPGANDAARLAADPLHKLLLDRDPGAGRDLASQPTLSRFENAVGAKQLYRLSEALAASVIQCHAERLRGGVRRVTLDPDLTDDPTHGAQQLSFFNRHYDTWCYAARTWPQERRILIKAEVVRADGKEPKDNPRFVITNLKQSPQWIYEGPKVYCQRGEIGVSSQGHIIQSVKVRPRLKDSGLVAGEAPWRESKTVEPSDNMLRKEYAQRTRLQRAVNADVASLHAISGG